MSRESHGVAAMQRFAIVLTLIEHGFQDMDGYKRIHLGDALWAGRRMGELTFEAHPEGKDVRMRILVAISTGHFETTKVMVLWMASRISEIGKYQPAFDAIERSWEWDR